MIEKTILIIIWNICAMIVFYANTDDDAKPFDRFINIVISWIFAFALAPFEIAKAIKKINNSKTEENENK